MLTWFTTILAESGQTSSKNIQTVFTQGASGLNNIYDHFGKSDDRSQFDGTVQLNDLYCLMFLIIKIVFGNVWIFGCNADQLV